MQKELRERYAGVLESLEEAFQKTHELSCNLDPKCSESVDSLNTQLLENIRLLASIGLNNTQIRLLAEQTKDTAYSASEAFSSYRKTLIASNLLNLTCESADQIIELEETRRDLLDTGTDQNARLITFVLDRYYRRYTDIHDELKQEAYLGLRRGLSEYDPESGYEFTTIAVKCIKNRVNKALRSYHSNAFKMSSYTWGQASKMIRTRGKLSHQLGRRPTIDEVARKMDWSVERVAYYLNIKRLSRGTFA